ncbi:S8 family serine peptidase [Tichowtungia aerotolerans]|nr:S8 family serine peptidase [Tichowtungia aerotolerans]
MTQKQRNTLKSIAMCSVFLWMLPSSFADQKSRFAEFPSERAAFAEQLASEARTRRAEAEAWAKSNHVPVRVDDGRQLREIVAIRNGKPLYIKTLNADAAISTAANLVRQTVPYSLDGSGIKIGIWDGGSVLTTHQEFGSRITNKNSADSHYHATHVGGTIAALGVVSSAKGMAPAISVDSYDWTSDYSEMTSAAATAPGESATRIYLSNHSYGYYTGWEYEWNETSSAYEWVFYGFDEFGQYNTYARDLDKLISDAQYYLPFWSAGNDRNDDGDGPEPGDGEYKNGYDNISFSGIAKNVMTVGAVYDAVSGGSRSTGNAGMTVFSSWGPADDGRIKPDIVANGYGLYSCDNDNNSDYAYMSGTSMSSPNACGSAALLVEYYKELFAGGAMFASTLKGLIIHTADDLGNAGPDYKFGWGLMNTKAAADLLKDVAENGTQRIVEDLLTSGDMSDTYTIASTGIEPLKVTLCWTDQAGLSTTASDDRTPDLVNDLDLKVIDPNGGTNYPYKLSYANPTGIATTDSENSVDNVEQVYIENPVAGQYTVLIDCDEALYDNHPSPNSGGDQTYSLLISGIPSDSDGDGISDQWENLYFSSSTGAVATADTDGDGADNLTEYISGCNPTNPDSVFEVTSFSPPVTNSEGVIITWNPVEGRVYNVDLNNSLLLGSFTNISGDLPYPANSYTDRVERTDEQIFYRIGVRLDQ